MLDVIRNIVLDLNATGADGFEGLIGEVIYGITGIPSRLAKSGTQFGIDGDSIFPSDDICFEAKLYSGKLPKDEVITKVATLATHKEEADLLWVLGATTAVAAQDATLLRNIASKDGISVLILDWQDQPLPLLAVALAMAKDRVLPFISKVLKGSHITQPLEEAFDWLVRHDAYYQLSEKLSRQFNAVELATINAKRANKEWLKATFSQKDEARSKLGQPIAPFQFPVATLPRNSIVQQIEQEFINEKRIVFLLGEEGCGKSWVAASVIDKFDGISIFLSAERLERHTTEEEIIHLLITTLATQCSQFCHDDVIIKRWYKRLQGWEQNKQTSRLLIVLDGLNQRPEFPWDKIIGKLYKVVSKVGGQLIVTTREQLFRRKIKHGLSNHFLEIIVSNWSEPERDELLYLNGISIQSLDSTTASSLLNPRLLGIALEVLPLDNLDAWESLTTDRLLFEHLRLSQRDNIEPYTADELAKRLSDHASDALDKLQANPANTAALLFQSDTGYVAEGRFFEILGGPSLRYRLKEPGLTLALGYALVDRIWAAYYDNQNLEEVLFQLLEPIAALDRTVEVVLASLTICALDDQRFEDKVFVTLLCGFSNLQNPDTKKYGFFRDICFVRFDAFLLALEKCFLDMTYRLNTGWLKAVAWEVAVNDDNWASLSVALDRWLGFYSKNPEHRFRFYAKENFDDWQEKVKNKESEIKTAIDSLAPFELALLAEMQEQDGNISALSQLVLELLVEKPLAPFARSFLKWGISLGINADHLAPRDEFYHLTNFNKVDWPEMCSAFCQAIEPLDKQSTSKGGKWTIVRMLYATGTHEDALKAKIIATELQKDRQSFKGWRLIEEYCATDPCDPASEKPENIITTAQRYEQIDVRELYVTMKGSKQGLFRDDALPGVARFSPEIAINKHRELLATLSKRTDMPLRQLSLNGIFMMPLLTEQLATEFFVDLLDSSRLKTVPKEDQFLVGMYVFWLISRKLNAEQQLEIMSLPIFSSKHYLMDIIPSLKDFDDKKFLEKFSEACCSNDAGKLVPALAFLQYTHIKLNGELIKLILSLISHPNFIVRCGVFDIIQKNQILDGIKILYDTGCTFNSKSINRHEAYYGSLVFIEGYRLGLFSIDEIFERCSLTAWVSALPNLKKEDQFKIIAVLDISLKLLVLNKEKISLPEIKIFLKEADIGYLHHYSLDGFIMDKKNLFDYESEDEFEARQKLLNETYDNFYTSLDINIAVLILDRLTVSDIDNIYFCDNHIIKRWFKLLLSANDSILKNMSLLVAKSYSLNNPLEATKLFRKALELDSFVTVSYGNGLNTEHITVWQAENSESVDELRRERLNKATNDHDIAMQVLAAETCGKGHFILDYVSNGLKDTHPYVRSRAIMVAGFSNQTESFSKTLEAAAQQSGLVGDVAKVALEAHKRCCWTQHWAKKMIEVQTVEEFWCASRLLVKIADGRLRLFLDNQTNLGLHWPNFKKIIADETKKRSEKWESKRKETFLGHKSVNEIYM